MALTTCRECKQQISTEADACPNCGAKKKKFFSAGGCTLLGCLGMIPVLIFTAYTCSSTFREGLNQGLGKQPEAAVDQLGLISFTFSKITDSHVKAEGQVVNISGESLRNVQAVITYTDIKGSFITSDSALIDFNPILQGQTSPFSVITAYNPEMRTASVQFKTIGGSQIQHTDRTVKK